VKHLAIDEAMFTLAFDRHVDFTMHHPQSAYLDRDSGDVIWIYHDDEDAEMEAGVPAEENRVLRERISAAPERYLEIIGLSHGDHHDILRAFLDSDWTADEEARERAWSAYSGSIGRWKKTVADRAIIHAFYDFQEKRAKEMAEQFLREHGIEPQWR
jgi:Uncharacterised protein family (UPF0158)